MKVFFFFVACVLASAYALVGNYCESLEDCDANECCDIPRTMMVVSKRQAGILPLEQPTNGTCQLYKVEGGSCSYFDKLNGHCGCAPDLYCHTYEQAIATEIPPPSKRAPRPNRPGYIWVSRCERAE